MFSSRLNWDLRPNPLSILLDHKRAQGAEILDLTESNPTRAGFTYPPEEILAALADPAALRYDPSPPGHLIARQAIASYYRDRGREIAPADILLTASTSEAYAWLFKLLCDPGDEILTPRPSYPLFEFLAALESVHVRQYPLRYDGAWRIDFPALEASLTNRSRAIVVVNPNNPTGSFIASEELDRLQSLAALRGIAILIDEVFSDYRFLPVASAPHTTSNRRERPPSDSAETAPSVHSQTSRDQRERFKKILPREHSERTPAEHSERTPARDRGAFRAERFKEILPREHSDPTPADPTPIPSAQALTFRMSGLSKIDEPRPQGAADAEAHQTVVFPRERLQPDHPPQALTFRMSGLSKIAGLPQLKLGWIAIEGPPDGAARDRLELIADTYLSVATPVQYALPRLLQTSESIRAQILNRARANLELLRTLASGSASNVLNVEGGWYATLQVPRTRSEESWALTLLADHDVLIQPGYFFDFESEAFLVVSLITPPEIFAEGIRRIISLTG